MKGLQCDNCRKFCQQEHGWLGVIQYGEQGWGIPFTGPSFETKGTFCSMKCLAECAYVYVALKEANDKSEARDTNP